jgi:hypothetical protein
MEESMDKKTVGIIVTVAAIVLCGCPGLCSLVFGAMFAIISRIPGADLDMMGSRDPQSALTFGLGGVCVGIVLILIAAAAIVLARRSQAHTQPQ